MCAWKFYSETDIKISLDSQYVKITDYKYFVLRDEGISFLSVL